MDRGLLAPFLLSLSLSPSLAPPILMLVYGLFKTLSEIGAPPPTTKSQAAAKRACESPRRNPNPIVSESVAFPAEKGVRERGKGISSPPNDDYPGAFFSEGRNEGYQGGEYSCCTFFATCGTFDTLDRLQVLLQMRYCIGGI